MRRIFTHCLLVGLVSFLLPLAPCSLPLYAADRLVGGDLSLVPAYEQAGDQWLDESGNVITDLITYVKGKGWNAVRVRVFVDPSKDSDPATCQDLTYAVALSKRVKQAGMTLLVDLHYSDTWADPGQQKIPASWTDHSDEGLATQVAAYTRQVMDALVAAGATPDYVQIGNEITYGMLWNTADGKYPTDKNKYVEAGYCPTWSDKFSDGESQWRRLALFLNAGAKAVRETVSAAKVVLHTTMLTNLNQTLNFHKHLATAGFTDFDVIGLSYYPFWSGKLDNLGTVLSKFKTTYPEKSVQIVETAWYNGYYPYTENAEGEYALSSLPSTWTADAKGMVNYLSDLTTKLKLYDNVDGLYYWQPEECGNGYNKKVMGGWLNRGMWPSANQKQHPLLRTSDGQNPVEALARYVKDDEVVEHEDASQYFENLGFETGTLDGWTIEQTFTTQKASNITSWASKDVVRGTYSLELWNDKIPGGNIMGQAAQLPNGRYTVSVRACANKTGFYLYAGDAKTLIKGDKQADLWAATTNVKKGVLEFGIGARQSSEDNYAYFDDFTVIRIGDATDEADVDNTGNEDPEVPKDDEFTDEQNIVYQLYPADMVASVKNGKECLDSLYIPSTITVNDVTYYVNNIAGSAFSKNDRILYVKIPKSVRSINGSAFADCWSLNGVEFEAGSELKTIDGWAFYNTSLDSIDVPRGVTEISEGAFAHCWDLHKIVLRGEVTKIRKFAFSSWSADEESQAAASGSPLSQGVWIYATEAPEIDPKAFCPEDIKEKSLYVHYTLLENEAYKSLGFSEILPLDKSDGSIAYTDLQGVRYKLWPEEGTATVVGYDKVHAPELVTDWQIVIPETIEWEDAEYEVNSVAAEAFSGHWTLTAVSLPETLTSIGAWAFYNTGLSSIFVADGVTEIAEGTFSKCWNLKSVELMGKLTSIADFAFSAWATEGCASSGGQLQRVILWSKSAPEISPRAFYADDIKDGILYVDKNLTTADAYTSLGFQQVLPIDPTGVVEVKNEKGKVKNEFFDLSGRKVSPCPSPLAPCPLKQGVYIRDGRKIVVK